MAKKETLDIECVHGALAVGDKFVAGKVYQVEIKEAEELIKAGKMKLAEKE